ncbi:putative signal transducing protein [Candidatus Omnitrophota bacterium]
MCKKRDIQMAKWVTIHITSDEAEAYLIQGVLIEHGIECVMESSIYRPRVVVPLFNEFKLNVLEEHAQEAQEVIANEGK